MRTFYKTVIVGAGASGLMLANMLSESIGANNILLIEKLDRVGKKLSQTGNGQGNLTNTDLTLSHFHSSEKQFPFYAINTYSQKEIENFYEKIGIFLTGDGKRYPIGKQASAVTDALRLNLERKKVNVLLNTTVNFVSQEKGTFNIETSCGQFRSENLVLAFGGKTSKAYGTDGSAYSIAENLGHSLTNLYPSLVQLKTDTTFLKGLKGIKTEAKVSANGVSFLGDLLFTDYGVSGNTVFSISSYVNAGDQITVEFLPELGKEQLLLFLEKRKALGYEKEQLLGGLVHRLIAKAVIDRGGNLVDQIVETLKKFTLQVKGTLGFEYAQVTKGGINVCEIDEKTMQSKIVPNLYVVGEALDVDGDCGGYNLHWAFSSASVANENIRKYYEDR